MGIFYQPKIAEFQKKSDMAHSRGFAQKPCVPK